MMVEYAFFMADYNANTIYKVLSDSKENAIKKMTNYLNRDGFDEDYWECSAESFCEDFIFEVITIK